jgi:ferredoxin/flavodoxin---NADP+ reductase
METMANLRVLDLRFLTPETFVLRTEKPQMDMKAGQCFSLGTAKLGINREYSIYSGANDPYLEFLIRKVPEGSVSHALSRCEIGDEVQVGGPYGEFCLDEADLSRARFIFFATGTGIAPFRSFSLTYPELNFEIHHGVRFPEEQYEGDLYRDGCYRSYLSGTSRGKIKNYVTESASSIRIDPDDKFYLCGNRNMINDVIAILRKRKVSGSSIFTETFF